MITETEVIRNIRANPPLSAALTSIGGKHVVSVKLDGFPAQCPLWVVGKRCRNPYGERRKAPCYCDRNRGPVLSYIDHPRRVKLDDGSRAVIWQPYGSVDLDDTFIDFARALAADGVEVTISPYSDHAPGRTVGIIFTARR